MFLRILVLFVLFITTALGGWTWLTLTWSYSEGERAGYVQKLARKGWLCKTWEGEIAMVTMPGAIPDRFEFSVRDDAVAARINALSGRRVVLTYQQHKFVPTTCFAETEYFVIDARALDDTPVSPAPPVVPGTPPVSVLPAMPAPAAPASPVTPVTPAVPASTAGAAPAPALPAAQ